MSRIKSRKIQFTSDNNVLDARLDKPDEAPVAYAIFCHCFTCTKETIATYRISRLLAQHGIAVLRFDFTGLGQSQGRFEDTNFSTMVEDIIAADGYLKENFQAPTILLGHSMGGTAVLAASLQLENIETVITIASPSKPSHVLHHFGPALAELEAGRPADFRVAGMKYPMKPQFVNDVRSTDTQTLFQGIDIPVVSFVARSDDIVEAHNAEEICDWTGGRSEIITLEDANHLISDIEDARLICDHILNWLSRNDIL